MFLGRLASSFVTTEREEEEEGRMTKQQRTESASMRQQGKSERKVEVAGECECKHEAVIFPKDRGFITTTGIPYRGEPDIDCSVEILTCMQ